jgi:hypothetical protein
MFFVILLSWVAAGLVTGFVISKLVNLRGDDPRLGMGVAVASAVVAAVIFSLARGYAMTIWALWPLVIALVAALVGTALWHVIRSRTISHDRYVPRQSY